MILEKLVEKKDVLAYCAFRKKHLVAIRNKEMPRHLKANKAIVSAKFTGRIEELAELEKVLRANKLKENSKKYAGGTR